LFDIILNGESKVANLSLTVLAEEYILRFDIKMQDFLSMDIL